MTVLCPCQWLISALSVVTVLVTCAALDLPALFVLALYIVVLSWISFLRRLELSDLTV